MRPATSRDGEGIGAMNALAVGPQADRIGRVWCAARMTSIVNRGGKAVGDAVSAYCDSCLVRK